MDIKKITQYLLTVCLFAFSRYVSGHTYLAEIGNCTTDTLFKIHLQSNTNNDFAAWLPPRTTVHLTNLVQFDPQGKDISDGSKIYILSVKGSVESIFMEYAGETGGRKKKPWQTPRGLLTWRSYSNFPRLHQKLIRYRQTKSGGQLGIRIRPDGSYAMYPIKNAEVAIESL